NLWVDAAHRARLAGVLAEGNSFQDAHVSMRKKCGDVVDVLLSATCLLPRRDNLCIAAFGDFTRFKQAERMLWESEERFARAFHGNPQPTAIGRREGGAFLEVNEAWTRTFGYSREEALGRSMLELPACVDAGDRDKLLRMLGEEPSARDSELRLRRKSGE